MTSTENDDGHGLCVPRCDLPESNEILDCIDRVECINMMNDAESCETFFIKKCRLPMNCIDKQCLQVKLNEWIFWNLSIPCQYLDFQRCEN